MRGLLVWASLSPSCWGLSEDLCRTCHRTVPRQDWKTGVFIYLLMSLSTHTHTHPHTPYHPGPEEAPWCPRKPSGSEALRALREECRWITSHQSDGSPREGRLFCSEVGRLSSGVIKQYIDVISELKTFNQICHIYKHLT